MLVLAFLVLLVSWLPVIRRGRKNAKRGVSALSEVAQQTGRNAKEKLTRQDIPATDRHAIRAAVIKARGTPPQLQHPLGRTATSNHPDFSTATSGPSATTRAPNHTEMGSELAKSISGLRTRVGMLEEALDADALSPKEAMQEWVGLLTDCNEAHNSGRLPSTVFKDLNTRLLDLFTIQPTDGPPHT